MNGRAFFPLLLAIVSASRGVSAASSGEVWSASPAERDAPAGSQAAHRLDSGALDRLLANASLERMKDVRRSNVFLSLPMPDGSFERFVVEESPVMEPLLAAKFSDLKTYHGQGVEDPAASVRFMRTSIGFEAQILNTRGVVRVEAAGAGSPDLYRSTFWKGAPFQCAARFADELVGT